MSVTALHTAATGLSALSTQLDVIANNLANANNMGFKRSRVNFEDLLYQEKAQPGVENANEDQRPMGIFVGLGTRVAGTQLDFTQGSLIQTGEQLDMAIEGRGFFRVQLEDGEIGYTRSGNFTTNSDGEIVLANSDGRRLDPGIDIPQDAEQIDISSDGRVFAKLAGQVNLQEIAQIQLATFINPTGLEQIGGNLFVESTASGPEIVGNPGENSLGNIEQGHLEASNANPVTELITLIETQRAFEMNSQSIQAADESLQVITNLRRF